MEPVPKGFIYKYFSAFLGSASCHLLFIARLLLFALFLATVGQSDAKLLSLDYHQADQTLSLHLHGSFQERKSSQYEKESRFSQDAL